MASVLHERLFLALSTGDVSLLRQLEDVDPVDDRDAATSLLVIGDIYNGAYESVRDAARLQRHPVVAAIAWRLDERFLVRLARLDETHGPALAGPSHDAVASMRAIARVDQIPAVYEWAATTATLDRLVEFLALEGGPDGGFDDLVAVCQVGLGGEAKLELARNYWDEMGNGRLERVHTRLHQKLSRALGVTGLPREAQPLEALEKSALLTLLSTNRWLQPEMIGALGLIELQAGPRCRKIVAGLERLGASPDAIDFYAEHEIADPRHGSDWLGNVVAPLQVDAHWSDGIVRGARWRSAVNHAFVREMNRRFVEAPV